MPSQLTHGLQDDRLCVSSSKLLASKVCVIGAGVAGLSAAGYLKDLGCDVHVFEKEAIVGGRTRSIDLQGNVFDMGAQFVEASSDEFVPILRAWADSGIVQPWNPKMNIISRGHLTAPKCPSYHVGTRGQGSICKALAEERNLNLHVGVDVKSARRTEGGWSLLTQEADTKAELLFDALVFAVPPEDAVAILSSSASIAQQLIPVRSGRAWSLSLTLRRPLRVPFEVAVSKQNAVLTGFIRQNTKPDRNNHDETWWLQTKPDWALRQRDGAKVEAAMFQAFQDELGALDRIEKRDIIARHLHHWRAAWVPQDFAFSPSLVELARDGAIVDASMRLALCGDWVYSASGRGGGSIQGAFLSGSAVAKKLVETLS